MLYSYKDCVLSYRIVFENIKIEMLKNVLESSLKRRNDFCYLLGEIFNNCSIDENELSNEIIKGCDKSVWILLS